MEVRELRALKIDQLEEYGEKLGIADAKQISRDDLMRGVMAELAQAKDLQFTDGILELHPDGYGFLRSDSCLPGKADVYLSPSQIKRFSLRDGDLVSGPVRGPKNDERYFALLRADAVNGRDPEESRRRVQFQDLTPLHPDEHLKLELSSSSTTQARSRPDSSTCSARSARGSAGSSSRRRRRARRRS